jgi:hypothetical protein
MVQASFQEHRIKNHDIRYCTGRLDTYHKEVEVRNWNQEGCRDWFCLGREMVTKFSGGKSYRFFHSFDWISDQTLGTNPTIECNKICQGNNIKFQFNSDFFVYLLLFFAMLFLFIHLKFTYVFLKVRNFININKI